MPSLSCLIVDDSDAVRKVMRPIIEGLDIKVVEASSIKKARELCERRLPDLVLLDWHLPGEDCLGFLTELRNEAPRDKLKIIYLMTTLAPADVMKAKVAGADEVLGKPFLRVQLEVKILNCITPQTDLRPDFSPERPLTRAGIPVPMPIAGTSAEVAHVAKPARGGFSAFGLLRS